MRLPVLCLLLAIAAGSFAQSATPSAVLEGNVVNASNNAPIANARVRLDLKEPNEPIYTKVDPQGHFLFANLTPGQYRMSVDSPGFTRVTNLFASVTVQAAKLRGAPILQGDAKFAISTDPDGTIRGTVNVPLTAQAVITGKITDPYGLPAVGCTVEILSKNAPGLGAEPSHFTQVQTDDLGQYRVSGLKPGTYWVVANRGYAGIPLTWESSQRPTYYSAATSLDGARALALMAGQTIEADIQILKLAGVRVAGKVIKPPAAADSLVDIPGTGPQSFLYTQIALVPQGSPLLNPSAGSSIGRDDFELKDVLPGKYTLMALMRDASTDRTGPDQKPVAGLIRQVEIGQQDMLGFDLTLEPLRDLPGEVTFAAGCEAAPVAIHTYARGPFYGRQVEATSGADGKFVLSGLTTGNLQISVSPLHPPGPPARLSAARLGDRDVLAHGLDVPFAGDDPLRIKVDCASNGRVR